jgi:gamma-glutamyltranspeptidase/glutathione hydrolase
MTTSVEDAFGSRQMVDGFILNNQLTDFSFDSTRRQRPDRQPRRGRQAPAQRDEPDHRVRQEDRQADRGDRFAGRPG